MSSTTFYFIQHMFLILPFEVVGSSNYGTLKPQYNEPRNSEFLDIVNKTQL